MKKIFFCFLLLIGYEVSFSQINITAPSDTTSKLEILPGSGSYSFEKIDSLNTVVSLAHRARIKQDKTFIEADSAIANLYTKIVEAFGSVHINDSDTFNTYSQYVKYYGKEKKAILQHSVRLVDNKGGVLTTEELFYDLNTNIATYNKNGKIINKKTILTSQEGIYYGDTKDVIFKKEVLLTDPNYKVAADSLMYNTSTEIVRFICPTTIISETRKIYTTDGYYNLKTGEAYFGKRATIIDSTQSITANESAFDDKSKTAQFKGNVVYKDTAQGISILANLLNVDRNKSAFLATERPIMIIKQEQDSIYISADTLFSGKITERQKLRKIRSITDTIHGKTVFDLEGKDSAQNRFFEAFHQVRIYSDSMQAVCDSMLYASTDSIFRLFQNPVLWASNSQITADTIYLYTHEKKVDRLHAFENGFIINKLNSGDYFNQVKGRTINGIFKDGVIDYIRTKGNAESLYYATDEQEKLIGINKTTSDAIDMYFKDKKANKIIFRNDLKGTTYPVRQLSGEELKLKGFNWMDNKRPKSKYELF